MSSKVPPAPAACPTCQHTKFTEKMWGYRCDKCGYFHEHSRGKSFAQEPSKVALALGLSPLEELSAKQQKWIEDIYEKIA